MLPVPKFMLGRASRRRGDERAILTATTDARVGDRLVPVEQGLTVRTLREAAEMLRREGVEPRDVAGFGPAYQLDAPQAQVAQLCRTHWCRLYGGRLRGEALATFLGRVWACPDCRRALTSFHFRAELRRRWLALGQPRRAP